MTDFTRRNVLGGMTALAGAGAISPLLNSSATAAGKGVYQWGSASVGSTAYEIITVLAWAASNFTDERHAGLSTAGGAENMALLGQGVIDFGQSATTDWLPATSGTGRYQGNPVNVYQALSFMIWQTSPIVRANSDIQSLADLTGKRVMPGPAGGATNAMWETFFEAAGIEVEWTYGSWQETFDAMAAGAVDCIPTILTGGMASGGQQLLESNTAVRHLAISEELVARAAALNPGVMSAVVTPEEWPTLSEPTLMLGFGGVLAVNPDVPEDVVYNAVKAIYENAELIRQRGGPNLRFIDLQHATDYLMEAYPVHPGAAQFLKEAGVWNDRLTIGS